MQTQCNYSKPCSVLSAAQQRLLECIVHFHRIVRLFRWRKYEFALWRCFALNVRKSIAILIDSWQFVINSKMNTITLVTIKQQHMVITPAIWSMDNGLGFVLSTLNNRFLNERSHWFINPPDENLFISWLNDFSKHECFRKYITMGIACTICFVFKTCIFGKCKRLK